MARTTALRENNPYHDPETGEFTDKEHAGGGDFLAGDDGEPMVLFHGSSSDFSSFAPVPGEGEWTDASGPDMGGVGGRDTRLGVFLTTDDRYAEGRYAGPRGVTYEVRVRRPKGGTLVVDATDVETQDPDGLYDDVLDRDVWRKDGYEAALADLADTLRSQQKILIVKHPAGVRSVIVPDPAMIEIVDKWPGEKREGHLSDLQEFNPYHDPNDGRFTSREGGGAVNGALGRDEAERMAVSAVVGRGDWSTAPGPIDPEAITRARTVVSGAMAKLSADAEFNAEVKAWRRVYGNPGDQMTSRGAGEGQASVIRSRIEAVLGEGGITAIAEALTDLNAAMVDRHKVPSADLNDVVGHTNVFALFDALGYNGLPEVVDDLGELSSSAELWRGWGDHNQAWNTQTRTAERDIEAFREGPRYVSLNGALGNGTYMARRGRSNQGFGWAHVFAGQYGGMARMTYAKGTRFADAIALESLGRVLGYRMSRGSLAMSQAQYNTAQNVGLLGALAGYDAVNGYEPGEVLFLNRRKLRMERKWYTSDEAYSTVIHGRPPVRYREAVGDQAWTPALSKALAAWLATPEGQRRWLATGTPGLVEEAKAGTLRLQEVDPGQPGWALGRPPTNRKNRPLPIRTNAVYGTPKQVAFEQAMRAAQAAIGTLDAADRMRIMQVFASYRAELVSALTALQTAPPALGGDQGSWQTFHLQQLIGAVDDVSRRFALRYRDAHMAGILNSWKAGRITPGWMIEKAGVHLPAQALSTGQIEAAMRYSATLVTHVSAQVRRQIDANIFSSVMGKASPFDIVQRLAALLDPTPHIGTDDPRALRVGPGYARDPRVQADNVLRTEKGRVYSMATADELRHMAQFMPGLRKKWQHSGNPGPYARPYHRDVLHGQIKSLDADFNVNGHLGWGPHDAGLPVGEVARCGCRLVPWYAEWANYDTTDEREAIRQELVDDWMARFRSTT